mmetsp:Transcript_9096/g.22691  ORF Transcript_9096/g.22691 Transcript_9096/m.22691 type:complete len:239 (-) Transcript_9096:2215-2931(-)
MNVFPDAVGANTRALCRASTTSSNVRCHSSGSKPCTRPSGNPRGLARCSGAVANWNATGQFALSAAGEVASAMALAAVPLPLEREDDFVPGDAVAGAITASNSASKRGNLSLRAALAADRSNSWLRSAQPARESKPPTARQIDCMVWNVCFLLESSTGDLSSRSWAILSASLPATKLASLQSADQYSFTLPIRSCISESRPWISLAPNACQRDSASTTACKYCLLLLATRSAAAFCLI